MNDWDPLVLWARDVRSISPQQAVLRLLIFASPLGAVVAADQASPTAPATALLLIVIVLAAATAALPDSHIGLLLLIVVTVYWSGSVEDPDTPWALVAALCLLLFHAAAAAASIAPARARLDEPTVARWLQRCGVVALATGVIWALVAGAAADRAPGSIVLMVAAFVLVAGFGWLLLRRSTTG